MHQFVKTGLVLAWGATALFICLEPATGQVSAGTQSETRLEKPFLHPLFTDNMVLQRGIKAPVWGWARPGQEISVSLSGTSHKGATSTVKAGADGKWMAKLGPLSAGGPYTLTISGAQKTTLNNVMVGDVWLCSGQSNMEMGVGAIDAPEEIAAANNSNIRLFTVPKITAMAPLSTVPRATAATPRELTSGQWDVCTPQTISKGVYLGFSATAYFFAKNLQPKVNVPIGLIHSSWSGTVAEAWASAGVLQKMPDFAPTVAQVEAAAQNPNGPSFAQQMTTWWQKNDPGTDANWQAAEFDAGSWKTMNLPAGWERAGLPDFDGVVWFRKEVDVPLALAGQDLTLHLGPIDDSDTTFFNGVQVGSNEGWQTPRNYKIPKNLVKSGRNVIAVRVLDSGGGGGLYGTPDAMKLEAQDSAPINLAGAWSYNVSVPLNRTSPLPLQISNNPNVATVLYNGMIAPLVPFGIKGAIWYQGESNAGRARQYQTLLPTMITDWRNRFGVGEFPFFIVQLANFMAEQPQPGESAWAELRESQARIAQTLPNTGLAVAIDIGDANDIHPKNKQEVGRRLALAAQAIAYGQKIEYSGPIYKSMKVRNGRMRLRFSHTTGLFAKGGEKLRGFALAGADKKWVWADATIVGDEVVLSSPDVANPTAARYNWADNPNGNLINAAGLPAVPFRTDAP